MPVSLIEGDHNCAVRIIAERENAALLCEDLASRWEQSAAKTRADGTFTAWGIWPFTKRTTVHPRWEQSAKEIESAAHGLHMVAQIIRKGVRARKESSNAT